MPPLPRCLSALALMLAFALAPAAADETSEKQRKAAEANLKKGEVKKAVAVETTHFIVCATIPEARAKVLGESLEKAYASARKGLQLEEKESPWKGKLTVYYLTDRREFNLFTLAVAGEKTRDSYFISAKGDEPFLINGPELGEKTPEADLFFETSVLVASATIQGKYPAALLPEWVKNGFARAAALRAAGPTAPRYTAYRTKARRAVLGTPTKAPPPMANLWNDMPIDDRETTATSLMDYIVFGGGAKESVKFLRGFLPSDTVPMPGVAQALEAAGWKEPQLEAAWRKWVQTGK
jgi:hypothetical protein